jgi:hypothetical protein
MSALYARIEAPRKKQRKMLSLSSSIVEAYGEIIYKGALHE